MWRDEIAIGVEEGTLYLDIDIQCGSVIASLRLANPPIYLDELRREMCCLRVAR